MRGRSGVRVSTSWLAASAASIFLLVQSAAHAADDRFDPAKYEGLGGFKPVTNESYRKECGACHFVYLPGLLPARSWERVLDTLDNHFGENIQLSDSQRVALREYLTANATDKAQEKGAGVLLRSLDPDKTPVRITQVPHVRKMHIIVRDVMRTNATMAVRSITNCNECHQKADEGSFALHDTVVPGVSKVIKPGGLF
jgi:Dihaem cytochrome c